MQAEGVEGLEGVCADMVGGFGIGPDETEEGWDDVLVEEGGTGVGGVEVGNWGEDAKKDKSGIGISSTGGGGRDCGRRGCCRGRAVWCCVAQSKMSACRELGSGEGSEDGRERGSSSKEGSCHDGQRALGRASTQLLWSIVVLRGFQVE